LREQGAGFGTDTNSVTIYKQSAAGNQPSAIGESTKEGESLRLPLASKSDIAEGIISAIQPSADKD
ncbi:MAG: hypothetical protein IKO63_03860, partial [Paludibacteraceae bacterium]|nr:hypothetical protein [Paludibacteraceae bacterium]